MDRLRTFGIVAHIDAGKTTLTERILFDTGAQSWVGSVDEGTAAMDFLPAERSRGISITAAATRVGWGEHTLQVVDTPGHVDFVAEVERCLRVIDGVVVLVDAVRGVESQTRAVWRQTVAAGLPRLVFVNKLDRAGADFPGVLAEVAEQLECTAVAMVVPLHDESGRFAGLGDALTGAVQWFEGRPAAELVPGLKAELLAAHERLVEVAADHDEQVMAEVVAGRGVAAERLRAALRAAFLRGEVVPVLGGAALYNRGIDWLLDALVCFLPAVSELPARGIWALPGAGDPAGPACALVFKVQHLDRVWNYLRVVRGRLVAGAALARGQKPELPANEAAELWCVRGDRPEAVASAGPGEIVVVPGEHGWRTGDTVCDPRDVAVLPSPRFPSPVLAVTFEPDRAEDAARLYQAVQMLAVDDPTLRVARERDRIVVRGMGELHLEITADLVRARVGVGFRVSKPRVDRRETVTRRATGSAEVRALVAGSERTARCEVAVAPQPDGGPAAVVDEVGGAIAQTAMGELRHRALAGLHAGPLHDATLHLRAVAGEAGVEVLVEQAASKAFENALAAAGLVELEPWVAFEVLAPTGSSNAVLADLRARQAEVEGVAAGRLGARLTGRAPLARMLGYVTRLRSISKGLGQVSMRPAGFAVPGAAANGPG
ncbi:MAG TPA: GTP-binding protein [bacterium]|nr:GTP-binding protein [bacterium]